MNVNYRGCARRCHRNRWQSARLSAVGVFDQKALPSPFLLQTSRALWRVLRVPFWLGAGFTLGFLGP